MIRFFDPEVERSANDGAYRFTLYRVSLTKYFFINLEGVGGRSGTSVIYFRCIFSIEFNNAIGFSVKIIYE